MIALTRDDARRILEQAIGAAPAGTECQVSLESETTSHTRFALNEITTSGLAENTVLTVTVRKDGRSGTVTTNDLAPEGIRAATARAEAMRALMPVDPEAVDLLAKQDYAPLEKYDAACAAARAADRVGGVKATLAVAKKEGLTAAGFFQSGATTRAIANSKGNFGFHTATDTEFSTTMRTGDGTGSGWASAWSPRLDAIDAKTLARTAAGKGAGSVRPREIPPGDYTVILEPAAVANLFQSFQFGGLSRRNADEGRSVFSKQGGGNLIGETMFPASVTLVTDPFDPRVPGVPWSVGPSFGGGFAAGGAEGLPTRKVAWVEKGVLKTLFTDRYWARKTSSEPTPFPGSLVMTGGTATLDDLIASTEKGLLVTRFWYIRTVNPQTAQVTGLTRDGLFLIEKGKVAGPVVNLRFNESPVVMLQNLEAMTAAVPAGRMVLPAIKSRAFTFTSKSDAV